MVDQRNQFSTFFFCLCNLFISDKQNKQINIEQNQKKKLAPTTHHGLMIHGNNLPLDWNIFFNHGSEQKLINNNSSQMKRKDLQQKKKLNNLNLNDDNNNNKKKVEKNDPFSCFRYWVIHFCFFFIDIHFTSFNQPYIVFQIDLLYYHYYQHGFMELNR